MKNCILISFFCLLGFLSYGQHKYDLNPCKSPAGKSGWLKEYQQYPAAFRQGGDTIIYVPLTIHLLANDSGSGHFKLKSLFDALCRLNSDYAATNIQFYIEGEINELDNALWYNHNTVLEGAEMMFENNIENTLNCYVVSTAAGACGYNLPYAGIALAKQCMGAQDHTWAHEVGHALSLPHPFLGWEGGVSHDESVPHNYNDPAPEQVLYDYTYFQDTLILDTLIIDTAFVETIDAQNCYAASDGFCDTPPDYLNYRWPCNANQMSTVVQTDPNGVPFYSNGHFFMSYSFDECQDRFSEEETQAMRANLYTEKADFLYNQTPVPPVIGESVLLAPGQYDTVAMDEVVLEWAALENVANYYVQVSKFPDFTLLVFEGMVTENTLTLTELDRDKTYYWRVKGINSHSFCSPTSLLGIFYLSELVSVNQIAGGDLRIYPTILQQGEAVILESAFFMDNTLEVALYNAAGQLVLHKNIVNFDDQFRISMPQNVGLYFIKVRIKNEQIVEKLILNP